MNADIAQMKKKGCIRAVKQNNGYKNTDLSV